MTLPAPYYSDDYVTIYHGDCRDMLADLAADVIVTDPPYGIGYRTPPGGLHGNRPKGGWSVVGDDVPFDPRPVTTLGLPTVLFGANHYADRLPPSSSWVVWDKRHAMPSNDQGDAELAWTNLGGPVRVCRATWNGGGSLLRENGRQRAIHPTQKPIALMRWIIQRCPKGTILDPFMGSGSTLVAAKSLGRKAIGIEIEERYCERAARRCAQEVLGLSA